MSRPRHYSKLAEAKRQVPQDDGDAEAEWDAVRDLLGLGADEAEDDEPEGEQE